jgi:hypothetical protein
VAQIVKSDFRNTGFLDEALEDVDSAMRQKKCAGQRGEHVPLFSTSPAY